MVHGGMEKDMDTTVIGDIMGAYRGYIGILQGDAGKFLQLWIIEWKRRWKTKWQLGFMQWLICFLRFPTVRLFLRCS